MLECGTLCQDGIYIYFLIIWLMALVTTMTRWRVFEPSICPMQTTFFNFLGALC